MMVMVMMIHHARGDGGSLMSVGSQHIATKAYQGGGLHCTADTALCSRQNVALRLHSVAAMGSFYVATLTLEAVASSGKMNLARAAHLIADLQTIDRAPR